MFKKYISKLENIITLTQSLLTPKQFIFLSSVLVGISAAFAVILLKTFAHWVFKFATYVTIRANFFKLDILKVMLPVIGIVLTVFVVKNFLGGVIEKGTSQILYAVAKKASIIPKKQMYSQIVTSSLTVGLGGSAGLESPIVITGAAFGSNYAQKYRLNYKDRTLLIGCGVAAGIAAAFNAPIAGVLFAIEVLLVDVSISAFTPIMIAAAIGALVSTIVLDETIFLNFTEIEAFNYHNVLYYVILGLITGFTVVFYTRYFQKTESFFNSLTTSVYKKAFWGASLLSLLIFIFPTLFGEGFESIKILSQKDPGELLENTLFSEFRNNSWALLIFVGCSLLVKTFATGITVGSGGNGGNFAPALFLGAYIGFFFSKLLNLTGFTKLPVSNFAMIGMAGVLSGLFHAPLTAIFLIAEITGGYRLMIPLMIVSSISFAITKRFERYSLEAKNLVKKGHAFTTNKDMNVLATLDINTLIQTHYFTISPDENLEKLVDLISHSDQIVFAVISNENELLGIVHFNDIREIIFNPYRVKYTLVNEIMKNPIEIIDAVDSMETVMNKFEESKTAFLPVLQNGIYYGFISKTIALEAYRTKLKSMIIE